MKLPRRCGKCFRGMKLNNPVITVNGRDTLRCWVCLRQEAHAKRQQAA